MATITEASGEADVRAIRALFRAYAAAIGFDLAYQGFEAELAGLPGRYAAPGGTLLLGRDGQGAPVGCAGVRPHGADGACELKRLYVAPAARGSGLALELMRAALVFARRAGYRRMQLDTLPRMEAAIGLYRALGFAPVPAPAEDAGLGQIYFSKNLG